MQRAIAKDRLYLAFTLIELLVIILIVLLFLALALPAIHRAKERAATIQCISNLKQIGVGFKVWALDHSNSYPTHVSTNFGGTREYQANGEAFRHFHVISNEIATPLVLACPADLRKPATDFGPAMSDSNISYFVGLDAADDQPQMLVAGDRNLTNGMPPRNGILTLTTNSVVGWTHELHKVTGQVLLADGSVQQTSTAYLRQIVRNSGGTNRLAMP
jgi:competence protein ComGC